MSLTFLDISPNCKYLSLFFRGLCTPLFGTLLRLAMNGCSSLICVSGIVHTGGASLSIGFGIVIVAWVVHHDPFTIFDTAYGSWLVPRAKREEYLVKRYSICIRCSVKGNLAHIFMLILHLHDGSRVAHDGIVDKEREEDDKHVRLAARRCTVDSIVKLVVEQLKSKFLHAPPFRKWHELLWRSNE